MKVKEENVGKQAAHKQQINCKANQGPDITISGLEKRNEAVLYAWLPQRVDYVALVVVMCLSY
ncbi:hypothetical protein T02_4297 [Trichinella nativa]|uniref:Uncharacterized protein n=1 Tax=Trichinella nativa TaxID=6335 RepID=A0A0V1KUJ6_9BILA|nr:hypothetical protein T06_3550 [Trichinella sp. T6]KRZ50979.1 hypothetical protein T02_4297 [Trichinella nativa]